METLNRTVRLGEILTQCGLVTPSDLQTALDLASRDGIRIGEALLRTGAINEDKLTWALGAQFDLSYVDLDKEMIDWDYLSGFNLAELRQLRLLPISVIDGRVHAVVADPTADGLGSASERLFGRRPAVVQLASSHGIDEMLDEAEARKLFRAEAEREAEEPDEPEPNPPPDPMRWISMLDSREAESFAAVWLADTGWRFLQSYGARPQAHRLGEAEFAALWRVASGKAPAEFEAAPTAYSSRPPSAPNTLPARALAIAGTMGRIVGFEAFPAKPYPMQPRMIALGGSEQGVAKRALLAEAAASRASVTASSIFVSIESRIDAVVPGIFQIEEPDARKRVEIAGRLMCALRPRLIAVEIAAAEELDLLAGPLAVPRATALLAMMRPPMPREFDRLLPECVTGVILPDDFAQARDHASKILELGAL